MNPTAAEFPVPRRLFRSIPANFEIPRLLVPALVALVCLVAGPAGARMTSVGEPAAPFRLADIQGQVVQLQQRLEERAVLVFFSSVGCGPCEESAPAVRQAAERFADRLEVLVVMLSEAEAVQRWLAGGGGIVGARILTAVGGGAPYDTARAYGVMGTPTAFLVGQDAVVHWRHVGPITAQQVSRAIPAALDTAEEGLLAADQPATCRRFLVEERVFVSVLFRSDGAAGDIAWVDTVSGRRGGARFSAAENAVLQVEMPGGWCSRAHLLDDLAVVFRSPPWDPAAATVALGISLD